MARRRSAAKLSSHHFTVQQEGVEPSRSRLHPGLSRARLAGSATATHSSCPRSESNAHYNASEAFPSTGLGYEGVSNMPLEGVEPSLSRPSSVSLCRWSTEAYRNHAPGADRTLTDTGLSRVPLPYWDTEAQPVKHSPSRTRTWLGRLSAACTAAVLKDCKIGSGGRIRTAEYMVMSHAPSTAWRRRSNTPAAGLEPAPRRLTGGCSTGLG